MLLGLLRFSLLVFALLGGLVASARAQVSPAPPPTPPPAGEAATPSPADRSTVPAPRPTQGAPSSTLPAPAASVAAPKPGHPVPPIAPPVPAGRITSDVPGLDPALVNDAAKAKASGRVFEVADAAVVAGCRDLGQDWAQSEDVGSRGRSRIRIELRKTAIDRGASHLRFSEYYDGTTQSEAARFYDCATPRTAAGSEADSSLAPPRGSISVQFDVVPTGSLHFGFNGNSLSVDTAKTYGISTSLDYFVSPYLAIGVVPGLTFGLQGEGAMSSGTQLDLRIRARFGILAGNRLAIHGYGTVGGSWIYLPMDVTSSGATYGLGLVANFPTGDSSFVTLDLGYQFGNQSVNVEGVDLEVSSNLCHFGIGLGRYL